MNKSNFCAFFALLVVVGVVVGACYVLGGFALFFVGSGVVGLLVSAPEHDDADSVQG